MTLFTSDKVINFLIEDKTSLQRKYSEPTTQPCDHCGFTYTNPPFPVIVHFEFETSLGVPKNMYSSASCALAAIEYDKDFGGFLQNQIREWTVLYLKTVRHFTQKQIDTLEPAPHRRHLAPRGSITQDQLKFMQAILPVYETKTIPFQDSLTLCESVVSEIKWGGGEEKQKFTDFLVRSATLPSNSFEEDFQRLSKSQQVHVLDSQPSASTPPKKKTKRK